MAVRTLIVAPPLVKRGEVFDLRATIAHPMETGHRADGAGGVVPRDVVTRFECQLDGTTVFRATLYPAIAANPFVAFKLRAERSGTLAFAWEGDRGFRHSETVALNVGA